MIYLPMRIFGAYWRWSRGATLGAQGVVVEMTGGCCWCATDTGRDGTFPEAESNGARQPKTLWRANSRRRLASS